MRKIVDSNYLQHPKLREFLLRSQSNSAVLTDCAAVEAYKGDTLQSIFKSMAILSEFPNQVVVLKGTKVISLLSGRTSGLTRRLIVNNGDFHTKLSGADRTDITAWAGSDNDNRTGSCRVTFSLSPVFRAARQTTKRGRTGRANVHNVRPKTHPLLAS